jgi:hypothetical protein
VQCLTSPPDSPRVARFCCECLLQRPRLLVAGTMSLTLYVILDLEYPRLGMIRIDAADQPLFELRKQMR